MKIERERFYSINLLQLFTFLTTYVECESHIGKQQHQRQMILQESQVACDNFQEAVQDHLMTMHITTQRSIEFKYF